MSNDSNPGSSQQTAPPRLLTIREILEDSWHIYSAARRPLIVVCLMTVVIPELIFALFFAEFGSQQAEAIRSLFTSGKAAGSNVSQFVAPAAPVLGAFLASLAVLFVLALFGYFLIVKICYESRRGVPQPSASDHAAGMLRLALFYAVPLLAILFLVGLAHAFLLAAGIFMAILAFMTPVLIVVEGRRPVRAFIDSLTVRYAAHSPYRGWAVIIPLLSLGSASYALLWGLQELGRLVLNLDLWLPLRQETWQLTIAGRPYGLPFVVAQAIELSGSFLTSLFIPVVTVSIYGRVTDSRIDLAV